MSASQQACNREVIGLWTGRWIPTGPVSSKAAELAWVEDQCEETWKQATSYWETECGLFEFCGWVPA